MCSPKRVYRRKPKRLAMKTMARSAMRRGSTRNPRLTCRHQSSASASQPCDYCLP
jgi:hypothetical protein